MSKKKNHEGQMELMLFAPIDKAVNQLGAVREEIVDLVAVLLLDWVKRQKGKTPQQGGRDD